VEVRALSVPGRIEELARNTLGLVPVTPARTDYISAAQVPNIPASVPTR
jgi:cell division protein FtsL